LSRFRNSSSVDDESLCYDDDDVTMMIGFWMSKQ